MDALSLAAAEFVVSYIAPYVWTRNPKVSLLIAVTNVALMLAIANFFGWY